VSDHYPIELLVGLQSSHQKSSFSRHEASTSSYIPTSYIPRSDDLRIGAFNIRVFGRSKVADEDVLNILVKVSCSCCFT